MKEFDIKMLPKILEEAKQELEELRSTIQGKVGFYKDNLIIYPCGELPLLKGLVTNNYKEEPKNQLIHGENLLTMIYLNEMKGVNSMKGKFDLIYIDPPYNSKVNYYRKLKVYIQENKKAYDIKQLAYSDNWNNGLIGYLKMITPRLLLIYELLSDKGSVYVHVDYRVVHYVKIIMDNIFGNNFQNEIIWPKDAAGKGGKVKSKQWPRTYDSILFYSKGKRWHFIKQFTSLSSKQKAKFNLSDLDGRKFKSVNMGDTSQSKIESLRNEGKLYITTRTGKEYIKKYEDESKNIIGDIWLDIKGFGSNSRSNERVFFETQKPKEIIRRIINASCPKGGLVGDFFAGSGTTALVAEELGCNWVINDSSKISCMTSLERMIEGNCKPFIYQTVHESEKKYKNIKVNAEAFIDNNYKDNSSEKIIVCLKQYEIEGADFNSIKVDKVEDKNIINEAIVNKSISLIEYWDIDPDYNGNVFNSKWQSFIKQKNNVPNQISSIARLTVIKKNDIRTIAVRIIDIFGNEYKITKEL